CLDEDYLNYLKENNIEVINGDIKVETKEQFIAIRDYYVNYLKSNEELAEQVDLDNYDYFYNLGEYDYDASGLVALNIFLLNSHMISDELKQELIDEKIVVVGEQLFSCDLYAVNSFATSIPYYNRDSVNTGRDSFVTFNPIVFDGKIRKIYNMVENDMKSWNNNATANDYISLGDKYLMCFSDLDEDAEFKYSELDVMSKYYFHHYMIPMADLLKNNYQYWLYVSASIQSGLPHSIKDEIRNVTPKVKVK
ncbi:MAG: hypothetical protein MR227_02085, partial [Firmicutes bacterium]|nr:hypothetical protein [Bacillota bacterium]